MYQEMDLPERSCFKCNKTQLQLIDELCDLVIQQQTIKFDFSQEQQYVCEKCAKKTVIETKKGPAKKMNEAFKHWKSPVVIKYEKEQRERENYSKTRYISKLTIEILMHFRFRNQTIFEKESNLALNYEKEKEHQQRLLHGENGARQVYSKYISRENNGDGKVASGYRDDWEKGIAQIIDAFRNTSMTI